MIGTNAGQLASMLILTCLVLFGDVVTIMVGGVIGDSLNGLTRTQILSPVQDSINGIKGKIIMTTTGNWDKISGQWKQFSGDVKTKWGKLTDDELLQINGNREVLAGRLQEKYGIAKEDANKQIDEWADKLKV